MRAFCRTRCCKRQAQSTAQFKPYVSFSISRPEQTNAVNSTSACSVQQPCRRRTIVVVACIAASGSAGDEFEQQHADVDATRLEELAALVNLLPTSVKAALMEHRDFAQLIEVVMDLGRPPLARFPYGEVPLSDVLITNEDLAQAVTKIGTFDDDNRAGIDATLHRISCMRNRQGKIVGLTCRAGRAIEGSASLVEDLVTAGKSVLLLGKPGVGKTTAIREICRVLADGCSKRVVIVDTSNEIGGDGDVPHPGIGSARRMQVPQPQYQHRVMIEAVENHMPQVIVIDEIGTEAECTAARTIAQRGVQLVATAHGNELQNLIKNPSLADLIGGIATVTLGDEAAKKRGVQKTILERAAPPTFDVAVELLERGRWKVHLDVGEAVDKLLAGGEPAGQMRERGVSGGIATLDQRGTVRRVGPEGKLQRYELWVDQEGNEVLRPAKDKEKEKEERERDKTEAGGGGGAGAMLRRGSSGGGGGGGVSMLASLSRQQPGLPSLNHSFDWSIPTSSSASVPANPSFALPTPPVKFPVQSPPTAPATPSALAALSALRQQFDGPISPPNPASTNQGSQSTPRKALLFAFDEDVAETPGQSTEQVGATGMPDNFLRLSKSSSSSRGAASPAESVADSSDRASTAGSIMDSSSSTYWSDNESGSGYVAPITTSESYARATSAYGSSSPYPPPRGSSIISGASSSGSTGGSSSVQPMAPVVIPALTDLFGSRSGGVTTSISSVTDNGRGSSSGSSGSSSTSAPAAVLLWPPPQQPLQTFVRPTAVPTPAPWDDGSELVSGPSSGSSNAASGSSSSDGSGSSRGAASARRAAAASTMRIFLFMDDESAARVCAALEAIDSSGTLEVTNDVDMADVVIATKSKMRNSPRIKGAAKRLGVPLYAIRSTSTSSLLRDLCPLLGISPAGRTGRGNSRDSDSDAEAGEDEETEALPSNSRSMDLPASDEYADLMLSTVRELRHMPLDREFCATVLARFLEELPGGVTARSLATLVWGIAHVKHRKKFVAASGPQLRQLAAACQERLPEFSSQDLLRLATGFAGLRLPPPWLSALIAHSEAAAGELSGEDPAKLQQALSTLRELAAVEAAMELSAD